MSISDRLITLLCNPSAYDHEVHNISVIETHISWIILTGDFAYKIKKPIQFSFVDFSTLEKRKYYCYEEIRLNSRLAPDLYLGVVAITGDLKNPSFKDSGEAIEFAVKMRQFPQESMLSHLSSQNLLRKAHIIEMAGEVADFHTRIDAAPKESEFGEPGSVHHWVKDNFAQIESRLENKKDFTLLEKIKDWTEREYRKIYPQLQKRRSLGYVKECHGDMHLGNMVLIEEKVTIFDCIDFNEQLRWIDVISEVAFVVMDLHDRKHPEYAYQFLSLYLQQTGDYLGLTVFSYYFIYRAMVRAKVAILRMAQNNVTEAQIAHIQKEFNSYLELASHYIEKRKATLIITHGLSGSGKSTIAELLVGPLGGVQIRSDIERKRLYGYSAVEKTTSGINKNIYTKQSSKETYNQLAKFTKCVIDAGCSVIVDACFLKKEQRDKFRELALELQVPFIIIEFTATADTLRQRVMTRGAKKVKDPSEADINVLNYQLSNYFPIEDDEKKYTLTIDTEKKVRTDEIVAQIKNMT